MKKIILIPKISKATEIRKFKPSLVKRQRHISCFLNDLFLCLELVEVGVLGQPLDVGPRVASRCESWSHLQMWEGVIGRKSWLVFRLHLFLRKAAILEAPALSTFLQFCIFFQMLHHCSASYSRKVERLGDSQMRQFWSKF